LTFRSPFNTSEGPSPDYSPTSPNYRWVMQYQAYLDCLAWKLFSVLKYEISLCSPSGSYSPTAPGYSPSSTGPSNDKDEESTRWSCWEKYWGLHRRNETLFSSLFCMFDGLLRTFVLLKCMRSQCSRQNCAGFWAAPCCSEWWSRWDHVMLCMIIA
jgi:hypothetical protein